MYRSKWSIFGIRRGIYHWKWFPAVESSWTSRIHCFVVGLPSLVKSFRMNRFPFLAITVMHFPYFFFYLRFSMFFSKKTGLAIRLEYSFLVSSMMSTSSLSKALLSWIVIAAPFSISGFSITYSVFSLYYFSSGSFISFFFLRFFLSKNF